MAHFAVADLLLVFSFTDNGDNVWLGDVFLLLLSESTVALALSIEDHVLLKFSCLKGLYEFCKHLPCSSEQCVPGTCPSI